MVPGGMEKLVRPSKVDDQADIRLTTSAMPQFKLLCAHVITAEIYTFKRDSSKNKIASQFIMLNVNVNFYDQIQLNYS